MLLVKYLSTTPEVGITSWLIKLTAGRIETAICGWITKKPIPMRRSCRMGIG